MSWRRHIPNLLSSLRIGLAIFFPFLPSHFRIFAVIAALISEFLDGYLARRWNAISELGQFLDPVADKLFVLSTIGVLISEDKLTWFEFALVAMRDIIVAVGALSVWLGSRAEALRFLQPRPLGKIATAFQFAFLVSLFAFDDFVLPLFHVTATLSCVSGVDYLYFVLHRRFDKSSREFPLRA